MATEKILIFDEAGNAKRMKVRIARFLDNEPVTATDKENIRTTLDVDGSQSGTFTTPLSVTSASDSSFTGGGNVTVSSGDVIITGDTSDAYTAGTLKLTAGNLGTNSIQLGDVSDADIGKIEYKNSDNSLRFTTNATEAVTIDSSQRVGIGTPSPGYPLTVNGNSSLIGASSSIVGNNDPTNYLISTSSGKLLSKWYGGHEFYTAGSNLRWSIDFAGNLVANSTGIDFGSTTTGSGTVATNGGLLADYEFGDFTVTAGGTWTATPTSMAGKYVKVGNLVTCWVTFGGSPTKSSSLAGWLEGLPFSTNSYDGQGSVSDTGVTDRGVCYAANTNRLWLTNTSFGVTNIATVSYRHD